ncbi:MAG: F0F1 ATP synthase subunit B [Pseudomonadota bacterium]
MNINLTLVIQMVVFGLTVWIAMKFVWPMLQGPMEERAKKIATGLAAAEKGQLDAAQAEARAEVVVREARERANQILDAASKRSNEIVEAAKQAAQTEGDRLIASAKQQIDLEASKAREELRKQVAELTVRTAAKVLGREIDPARHAEILGKLATEI